MGPHCLDYAKVCSCSVTAVAKLFGILDNGNWVSRVSWVEEVKNSQNGEKNVTKGDKTEGPGKWAAKENQLVTDSQDL